MQKWSPHRQEPVAPFKNATSREFRIPPPAEAGGFQFAGIEEVFSFFLLCKMFTTAFVVALSLHSLDAAIMHIIVAIHMLYFNNPRNHRNSTNKD